MIDVAGLPAEQAIRKLEEAGYKPVIVETYPLRGARNVGTLRVIRWESETQTLLCARFIDTVSEASEIGIR